MVDYEKGVLYTMISFNHLHKKSLFRVMIASGFLAVFMVLFFGQSTAEARVDSSHKSHTTQGAKESIITTEYTTAKKSYNKVPKKVKDDWLNNRIPKGGKNYSMTSGKSLRYDVYAGVTDSSLKRGYSKANSTHVSIDGWATLFGYHHHYKGNHATYIGMVNKDTKERKIYKAAMRNTKGNLNNETNQDGVPYCNDNVFDVQPSTPTSSKPASRTTNCNMKYEYVYFRAYIPLDEVFENGNMQAEWDLYIIKEVENHLVYDRLVVPFDAETISYRKGNVDLVSGVNNDKLKVINRDVIKRSGANPNSSPLSNRTNSDGSYHSDRYFVYNRVYNLVKSKKLSDYVSEEYAMNVRYRVRDTVLNKNAWISSTFVMNQGTSATLKYTYDKPAPTKVINTGSKDVSSNTINVGDSFTYKIKHTIPSETKSFYYTTYKFEDTVSKAFAIGDVKVYNGKTDVTNKFTISKSNNKVTATAKSAELRKSGFYNKTYELVIPVTANGQDKLYDNHKGKDSFKVDNKASVTVNNKSKSSGNVTTTIKLPKKGEFHTPSKKVSKEKANIGDKLSYDIYHEISPEHRWFYYDNYTITDTIHGALVYNVSDVQVYDGTRNVTNKFTITKKDNDKSSDLTIRAKADSLKQADFYGKTYRININGHILDTKEIFKYVDDKLTFTMDNTATISIDNSSKKTNKTTTVVDLPPKGEYENPSKKVTDVDGKDVVSNEVKNGSSFTYNIYHKIPQEHQIWYYDDYMVKDDIHKALDIQSVKVYDSSNKDVTNRFDISHKDNHVQVKAKKSALDTASFYNTTYRVAVNTKVIDSSALLEFAGDKNTFKIDNKAYVTLNGSTKPTGDVTTNVVIPKIDLGFAKIEIVTNKASEGLKVDLTTSSNVEHTVFENNNVSLKLYQIDSDGNKKLIKTETFKVKDYPEKHTFVVESDMLDVNEKHNYVVELTDFNPNHINKKDDEQKIDTDGYTSSEKTITIDLSSSNSTNLKEKSVIKTEREIGKDMKLYHEELTIPLIKLGKQKTGYSVAFERPVTYTNDLGNKAEVHTDLYFDNAIGDDVYGVEDDKAKISMLRDVTDSEDGGKIKQNFVFNVPEVYLDSRDDKIFLESGDNRVSGGKRIYIPIWLDKLQKYDFTFKSSSGIGVNDVNFVIKDELDVYAYMFSHIESKSKNSKDVSPPTVLDEILITPIPSEEIGNYWGD